MLINEVSKITGLTKKAIEYYTGQGLVSPSVLENGYRNYSQNDIECLKKISVLRKLGIGTDDIKRIFDDDLVETLHEISVRKELSMEREQAKQAILIQLSNGLSYSEVSSNLQVIENSKTITEKLLEAFPGYYGRYICLHFARFLNEPIITKKQEAAYNKIIDFLDNVPSLTLPEELQGYLLEATQDIGTEQICELLDNTKKSIENPEEFLSYNKEILEPYLVYRKSDEYKNSPVGKIMELTKEFNSTSGYYNIFIPALKELSSSYSEYHNQLERAGKIFLGKYPDIQ